MFVKVVSSFWFTWCSCWFDQQWMESAPLGSGDHPDAKRDDSIENRDFKQCFFNSRGCPDIRVRVCLSHINNAAGDSPLNTEIPVVLGWAVEQQVETGHEHPAVGFCSQHNDTGSLPASWLKQNVFTFGRMKRDERPQLLRLLLISPGVGVLTLRGTSLLVLSAVKMSNGLSPASWGKVDLSRRRKSASWRPRGHCSFCTGTFWCTGGKHGRITQSVAQLSLNKAALI